MTALPYIRLLTDLAGTLLLVGSLLAALWTLARTRDLTRTRLLVADGILFGLSFKTAATLLRTGELSGWSQIAMFAAIFALRTVLGRVVGWERRTLRQEAGDGAGR